MRKMLPILAVAGIALLAAPAVRADRLAFGARMTVGRPGFGLGFGRPAPLYPLVRAHVLRHRAPVHALVAPFAPLFPRFVGARPFRPFYGVRSFRPLVHRTPVFQSFGRPGHPGRYFSHRPIGPRHL